MKNFLPKLSKNCVIAAGVGLGFTALMPAKLVVIAAAAAYIARKAGAVKLLFPDVWENEAEKGDVTKNHRVFVAKPVRIEGNWYIFQYVNRVVKNSKSDYFFYYPKKDAHSDGSNEPTQD